ncbi:unnamed protein product [Calicophoron daubneyi]|uniref:Uncharacterized protein n=1 Tax=Calicophoron daubneyi TaxID=300641 RepID=A0AAV2T3N6_CALDB
MRRKRGDIRVSRKSDPHDSGPLSTRQTTRRNLRSSKRTVHKTPVEKQKLTASSNAPKIRRPSSNSKESVIHALKKPVEDNAARKLAQSKKSKTDSSRGRVKIKEVDHQATEEKNVPVVNKTAVLATSRKRRRTDTSTYIQKRFLYDVTEPPKRMRHKKFNITGRSTATLVAVSSANLHRGRPRRNPQSRSAADEVSRRLRSRRGRRLKPRLEFSPSPSQDGDGGPMHQFQDELGYGRHKRRRTPRRPYRSKLGAALIGGRPSAWDTENLFRPEVDVATADEYSEPRDVDALHYYKHEFSTRSVPTYSDVLLGGRSRHSSEASEESRQVPRRSRHGNQRHPLVKTRHIDRQQISPDLVQRGSDSFRHSNLLPTGRISPTSRSHSSDLINFCNDPEAERFGRNKALEEIEASEEEYLQSDEPQAMSEDQTQPHEDLEEEDLLAPELSILRGPTHAEGVLLSGLSENGTMLSGITSGGSRRKSPVRPMQVLRTKSSTHTPSNSSTSPQVTLLSSTPDGSSFIFTQSPVIPTAEAYDSRLPEEEETSHCEDILPSIYHQPPITGQSQGDQEPSTKDVELDTGSAVVRITTLSTSDELHAEDDSEQRESVASPSSGQSPVCADGGSTQSGGTVVSSPVLPSILTQPTTRSVQQSILSRVFMTTNAAASSSNPARSSVPAKSLLSVSHAAVNRRRPSILKRGGITQGSAASLSATSIICQRPLIPEMDSEITHPPVTRTIGAFTPGASHSPKTHTTVHAKMPSTDSGQPTVSAKAHACPTKLLQLVTASSLGVAQPPTTSLTASDKLFGRRPVAYNKSSLISTSSAAFSTNALQYLDPPESQTTTTVPPLNPNTPYRYAVVRGAADGKRYLVLGNHGVFDRSNVGHTTNPGSSFIHSEHVVPLDTCVAMGNPLTSQEFELQLDQPLPSVSNSAEFSSQGHDEQQQHQQSQSGFSITTSALTPNVTSVGAT